MYDQENLIVDRSEHFALLFGAFSMGIIVLIFALRGQRNRIFEENMFKQRILLSQIFDMYMVRTESLRIRQKQLEAHRHVLEHGRVE
ncbi:TMhelix containing protein [Caenorhabditis elegans]|uniref:TMhelix containing protein n=1 Tax=Caenorhabditis elegans TaxID=6239 RepID=Q21699_CAEEL|nr:TMhelix containing protein [Caenorhabditis elegans]CAA94838.1 TMhelix containing protein [Caenorhabditis elegans]|eukprot:NP_505587.1 Uncharacterized protein CELE_R04B5.1 [Caenorhabditis elegans]